MASSSQLVLSQKTEKKPKQTARKTKNLPEWILTKKKKKVWGLFIHSFKDPSSD